MNDDIIALATRVGHHLREHDLALATAESCTGGGVGYAITAIPGSSEWFDRGFITYSNAAKTEMLAVPADMIAQHGAVSEEVAAAMAKGAVGNSKAQLAVSTTGIAGPGGAVPGKPVGTVCFGWSDSQRTHTDTVVFTGDRHAVREQTVRHALEGVLRFLAQ
jgi:nicotinamide-nucleotide amidase